MGEKRYKQSVQRVGERKDTWRCCQTGSEIGRGKSYGRGRCLRIEGALHLKSQEMSNPGVPYQIPLTLKRKKGYVMQSNSDNFQNGSPRATGFPGRKRGNGQWGSVLRGEPRGELKENGKRRGEIITT